LSNDETTFGSFSRTFASKSLLYSTLKPSLNLPQKSPKVGKRDGPLDKKHCSPLSSGAYAANGKVGQPVSNLRGEFFCQGEVLVEILLSPIPASKAKCVLVAETAISSRSRRATRTS